MSTLQMKAMKKCGSSKSTKHQCGSGNQRQTGKNCKAKVRGPKRERLAREDLMEMTKEPRGREELFEAILKMGERRKWGEQEGMRMPQELAAKNVEEQPRGITVRDIQE